MYEQFAFELFPKLTRSMSVALELAVITITISSPISERFMQKAVISMQDPKILIEQNTNG